MRVTPATTESESSDPSARLSTSARIQHLVVDLANRSIDRSEFLKRLATLFRVEFHSAAIAIDASHWSAPLILVADGMSAKQIDHEAIGHLLATATSMPVACEISVRDGSGRSGSARGIYVELTQEPERCSMLLVYPSNLRPEPETQVQDLQRLGDYAQATRGVAAQLPLRLDGELPAEEFQSQQPAASGVASGSSDLSLFHLDLDLYRTSYRIANESRRLIACDRATVLVRAGNRFVVKAVSGVSAVDSRSNAIRAMERMVQSAAVVSRPLVLPDAEDLPPQIQGCLDDYLDESSVTTAVLLPLREPTPDAGQADGVQRDLESNQIIGVLVLEYFSESDSIAVDRNMTRIAEMASLAIRNALEHKRIFGLRIWKTIGNLREGNHRPLLLTSIASALLLLLASMFFQIEHYVVATGSVEPAARREVFAPIGGIVKQLHVHDGQRVKAGDPLVELENAELSNRAESLAGEIQTAALRLNSISALRLSNSSDPDQSSRLVLEERQLKSELTNLRAQQEIVVTQQRELIITSPIDGTVVGWQLDRRLQNRPVARGDQLFSVADHDGPWSLRLRLPDRDAGPLLAQAQRSPALPIRFAVATQPQATYAATLQSIGTAARLDQWGRHVIDATASVTIADSEQSTTQPLDRFQPSEVRIGADVTAKITCGKRSILRSWFGDVIDFVHRNLFFYF